ncbi:MULTISPECIES: hypothetical protein [Pseudomonas]|uniref:Uncharacterized protein n=2 Tax=Pseudomonas TaxID=286 RepID=A0A2X2E9Z7_PSELU|nr:MULTISPECIES: hypothetical protein [Pseudomonas]SER22930.1 hypothetical protein SAMN05216409_11499 [Pseudomonas lutea]SPZ04979.1 Uncharacterised protein [Pseudomonas luteola]
MISLRNVDRSKIVNKHSKESLDERQRQYKLEEERLLEDCKARGCAMPRIVG